MGQRSYGGWWTLALVVGGVFLFSSCASNDSLAITMNTGIGRETEIAARDLVGKGMEAVLNEQDRQKLAEATQRTAVTGDPQTHKNRKTGVVIETKLAAINEKKEQPPPLRIIVQPYRVSPITKGNAVGIRHGPGIEYKVVGTLPHDKTVTVFAETFGWYLVSEDTGNIGFVSRVLVKPPPRDTAPAPGTFGIKTVDANLLCRVIERVIVEKNLRKHTEQITVCEGSDGWEIVL